MAAFGIVMQRHQKWTSGIVRIRSKKYNGWTWTHRDRWMDSNDWYLFLHLELRLSRFSSSGNLTQVVPECKKYRTGQVTRNKRAENRTIGQQKGKLCFLFFFSIYSRFSYPSLCNESAMVGLAGLQLPLAEAARNQKAYMKRLWSENDHKMIDSRFKCVKKENFGRSRHIRLHKILRSHSITTPRTIS